MRAILTFRYRSAGGTSSSESITIRSVSRFLQLCSLICLLLSVGVFDHDDCASAKPNLREHDEPEDGYADAASTPRHNSKYFSSHHDLSHERTPTIAPTRDPAQELSDMSHFQEGRYVSPVDRAHAGQGARADDRADWIIELEERLLSDNSTNSTMEPSMYPTESPTSAPTKFLTVLSDTTLYIIAGCIGGLAVMMFSCYYCCCQPSANKRKIATLLKFDDQLKK